MAQAPGMERMMMNGLNNSVLMKNIYYMIWADAIQSIRKHHPHKKDWKIAIFILTTWMHALNWWIIFIWLKYFNINIPLISLDFFPGHVLDSFLCFTIEFALPFGLLNYFLVFHHNRYEKIIERYKNQKTRYGLIYSISMALGAFFSAILYSILT